MNTQPLSAQDNMLLGFSVLQSTLGILERHNSRNLQILAWNVFSFSARLRARLMLEQCDTCVLGLVGLSAMH